MCGSIFQSYLVKCVPGLVLLVGEYRDVFVREGCALKLKERRCVYDNLLIPTALCIPV